jgi:hypothetical protein
MTLGQGLLVQRRSVTARPTTLAIGLGPVLLGVCILLGACIGLPGSGITQSDATRVAREQAGTDSTVVSVERAPLGEFVDEFALPEVPRETIVWAVVLEGDFPGECVITSTGESSCPPGADTALVVLRADTGGFLFLESPAPRR